MRNCEDGGSARLRLCRDGWNAKESAEDDVRLPFLRTDALSRQLLPRRLSAPSRARYSPPSNLTQQHPESIPNDRAIRLGRLLLPLRRLSRFLQRHRHDSQHAGSTLPRQARRFVAKWRKLEFTSTDHHTPQQLYVRPTHRISSSAYIAHRCASQITQTSLCRRAVQSYSGPLEL